jgi:hypothetical protein
MKSYKFNAAKDWSWILRHHKVAVLKELFVALEKISEQLTEIWRGQRKG